jgi:hypothetical protein
MQDDRSGVGTSLVDNVSNHAHAGLNSAGPHENPTVPILVRHLGLLAAYSGDGEERRKGRRWWLGFGVARATSQETV